MTEYILIGMILGILQPSVLYEAWDAWRMSKRNYSPLPMDYSNCEAWSIPADQYWPA